MQWHREPNSSQDPGGTAPTDTERAFAPGIAMVPRGMRGAGAVRQAHCYMRAQYVPSDPRTAQAGLQLAPSSKGRESLQRKGPPAPHASGAHPCPKIAAQRSRSPVVTACPGKPMAFFGLCQCPDFFGAFPGQALPCPAGRLFGPVLGWHRKHSAPCFPPHKH